jgi:hypothetical protein
MCATCGVWLTAQLMEHYRFGLDVEFLRDRAYPVIAGAAEFVLSMLVEDAAARCSSSRRPRRSITSSSRPARRRPSI